MIRIHWIRWGRLATCSLVAAVFSILTPSLYRPAAITAAEPPVVAGSRTARTETGTLPDFRPRGSILPPPIIPESPLEDLADEDDWTAEERRNIEVYERSNRSVVNIMTRTVRPDFLFRIEVAEGSGSGSVLDEQGHILTNLHVIDGAELIRVTLHTGETYEATLVGQDPLNDIAVLRIAAPPGDLVPVRLGNAARLRVGQRIYAIGNPFGLERTLTTGIISSLNRTLPSRNERRMRAIIQIDAALNRGNSGGPLLNSRGELIGMNTAIASSTGENTGVGFAIPVSTIRRVVPQLIASGRVIRPDSGILPVQSDRGLLIGRLIPGGPGERAGLQGIRLTREQSQRGPFVYERTRIDQSQADVILAVDGASVQTRDDFLAEIESKRPGDQVTLRINRQGQTIDVLLRLDASPP
jgi:S1-C subfamily serine protease